jgi:hypothetical protein
VAAVGVAAGTVVDALSGVGSGLGPDVGGLEVIATPFLLPNAQRSRRRLGGTRSSWASLCWPFCDSRGLVPDLLVVDGPRTPIERAMAKRP